MSGGDIIVVMNELRMEDVPLTVRLGEHALARFGLTL